MQNSKQLPPEEDYLKIIFARFSTAFKVLTAKKAIIIIDNDITIFNMEKTEILEVASQIVGELAFEMFESENSRQDQAIHNLVYGN
jgi:hypothetical protein